MEGRSDFKLANRIEIEHLQQHLERVATSKNLSLPVQAYDRTNPQQDYYKQLNRINNDFLQCRIGLRVLALVREQEDLAFFCLSYLEAEIQLPLKVSVVNGNQVWVEVKILRQSQKEASSDIDTEKRALKLLEEVRSKLKEFIETNITWDKMTEETYEDTKIIKLFKKQVIDNIQQLYRRHMLKDK